MVSLARPCVSLFISLLTFPVSFRFRIWFSICSRGISTPLSTHQIQAVSFLHFRHVGSRSGFHFALFLHLPTRWILREKVVRRETEESIRTVLVPFRLPLGRFYSVYIYPCDVVGPSLLHHHHQAQDTETPRWTVREHSATEEQTKQKRASIVHCYRVSFCVLLVALCYYLFNHTVSSQFHTFFLWFLAILLCHLLYSGRVLCGQPDYLLCF